jgi:hypothetical protein
MNRLQVFTIAIAASAVILTSCSDQNSGTNNTASGAPSGGASGPIAGGDSGNSIDQEQAEELHADAPATYAHLRQNQPLTVTDVKALSRARVSDDIIISQIQNSRTVYHLSPQDIIDMHAAGVSDRVVNFMITTVNGPPAPPPTTIVYSDDPPPPQDEVVVAPPGPGYFWISGEWQWNGVGWAWIGGHWAYPPRPNAVWVRGYWYRGPVGGWRHAPGHWR